MARFSVEDRGAGREFGQWRGMESLPFFSSHVSGKTHTNKAKIRRK